VLAESTGARAALAEAEPALAALRQRRAIDYPAVWAIKQRVLRAAHGDLAGELRDGALAPSFRAFVAGGGSALTAFATFEAIAEAHADKRFPYWPAGLRRLDAADVPAFAREQAEQVHFHLFLQWLADRQLGQAAARAGGAGLSLGFYRDLAVGSAPDGAEIWSQPGLSLPGVSVGAPPDPFSAQGQVWGLPPINPQAMRRQGFAGLAALLAANMRHAGALRIDHVMALARLFVVPEGAPGSAGTYLAMPLEAMLAEVCLASHRHRCLVVGEDLGTVPEGFRERLAAADVLSYRVLFFEREGRHVAEGVGAEGFRPLGQYPAKAVACVSTHDLPTFRGWRQGADIAEAATLGLLPEAAVPHRLAERRAEEAALGAMLVGEGLAPATDDDTALAAAVHAAVARTPAMLAMAQADDLAGETTAVNLPGTDRERPNWRRRLEMPVEDLFSREPGRSILAALRREE
jgi:glycogen operon protein